jgi:hypothetical protein
MCSLIAVVYLFIAVRGFKTYDFIKVSWLLLLIGLFLFFLGESMYSILEIVFNMDMNKNFPSIADILWCTGYFPMFISLMMMFNGYKKTGFPMGNIKIYGIISIIFIIISASIIYYLLIPIISDPKSDMLTKIFSLFYPIADLFLVVPALLLMYITSLIGKGRWPWKYIAIGFIFFTFSDLIYSYLSWMNAYGSGNFIDVGWNSGYLLIALSAAYQMELLDTVNKR